MGIRRWLVSSVGLTIACAPATRTPPAPQSPTTAPSELATTPPTSPVTSTPRGWILAGARPEDYLAVRDTATRRSGTASGRLSARTSAPSGFGTLMQTVQSGAYAGRRLRLSAQVRTRGALRAALWMRVDGARQTLAFDNMDDRPLSGDSEWLHQSIVLDVPPSPPSIGVAFGVILSGPGDVWIDDVVLEAVGSDVPPTKPSSPFGAMPVDSATMVARYAMLPMAPRNLGFENP